MPRMARRRGIVRLGLALGTLLLLGGSLSPAQRLPLKSYSVSDGLASDFVNDIVSDSRGFLWICTRDGLSRFDGTAFTNYGAREGLPHATINHLLEDRDGVVWIATNGGGVARLDPGARASPDAALFAVHSTGDTLISNRVNVLHLDPGGHLWAGTDLGLFRLQDADPARPFERRSLSGPESREPRVWAITDGPHGDLWLGTDRGLWRATPDGETIVQSLGPGREGDVFALAADRTGTLWVGHSTGLLELHPGPSAAAAGSGPPSRVRSVASGGVRSIRRLGDGGLAFSLDRRLGIIDNHRLRIHGTDQGVQDVRTIGEDSAGNIWVGTYRGAMRIVRDGLLTFDSAAGLGRAGEAAGGVHGARGTVATLNTKSIQEGPDGKLYVISGQWIANRLDGDELTSVRLQVPENATHLWSSTVGFLDSLGRWWALTTEGLARFPPLPLEELAGQPPERVYRRLDGLDGRAVSTVFEDGRGDLWIGVRGGEPGLVRLDAREETFHRVDESTGLPAGRAPEVILEDRAGRLWIGFYNGGLARRVNGRFEDLSRLPGAPRGGVHTLLVDDEDRLWIGSTGGGLLRVDDPAAPSPSFRTYGTADGLSSDNIRCLSQDRWGRIYAGTPKGVTRLDPESGAVRIFTTDHGLANNFVDVALRDSRGHLWFGTQLGLSRLVPTWRPPAAPPPVLIRRVSLGGRTHPVSELGASRVEGVVLGPRENQALVEYFSIGFEAGDAPLFQYRLEGRGAAWSEPSPRRAVQIASLGAGWHEFAVRTVRPDGLAAGPPAFIQFRVLPPLWRRWWALLLAALAVAGAVYALHRYRVFRTLEIERVRRRIATDLHDDIGSSLSEVAILSEVARRQTPSSPTTADETLAEIARVSRELIDTMSDIVWTVNPARDRMEDLVKRMHRFAGHVLGPQDIRFRFDPPGEGWRRRLRPDVRRELFLVFKECLNNAARHSGCDLVEIRLATRDGRMDLSVTDNGAGFDTSGAGDGHGLDSMRRRAESLGGTLEVRSGKGRGTRVEFRLPLDLRR